MSPMLQKKEVKYTLPAISFSILLLTFVFHLQLNHIQWGQCVHYYGMSAGAIPADVYLCFFT